MILEGGSEVAGVSLLAYGVVSALVSLTTWRVLMRVARDRPLVEAEAAGWLSGVPGSAIVAAGGMVVLLLGGTRFAVAAPYVDPALVIIVSLGLVVIPVGCCGASFRDLQTARPDSELVAQVQTVVEGVRTAEGLPAPILRAGRLGAVLDVALAFVLPPGTADITCQDRVRCAVRDGLGDLPYNVWLTVEFGYEAELSKRVGPDRGRPLQAATALDLPALGRQHPRRARASAHALQRRPQHDLGLPGETSEGPAGSNPPAASR